VDELDDGGRSASLPGFLKDPRGVLRRRWPWMLLVLAAASILAAGVTLGWPLRYEAAAKLLLSSQRIPEDFVRTTSSETIDEQMNALLGELLSRDALAKIVDEHELDRGSDEPREAFIAGMRERITVEPETVIRAGRRETGALILAIRYEADDPQTAATVANELADTIVTVHIRRRSRQAQLTSDFLRRDLERAEADLKEQRARIAEFKQRYRGELPTELQTALARLERLQQQRQSLAIQISDAESRLFLVQSQPVDDPRRTLLAELRTRLATEHSAHTDEHPNVIALKERITELELELAGEAGGASAASSAAVLVAQRELASLRSQLAATDREMKDLDDRVERTPAREEELAALEQREQVLRDGYTESLRKLEEAELAQSLEQAQQGMQLARLETATPPGEPKLPRWKLAAGAALAVLAATLGVGILLEWIDPVVLSGEELESLTGVLNLGEIPKMT
jgi:uncharacterized protein involved in exopolysaccharide biosynthesis